MRSLKLKFDKIVNLQCEVTCFSRLFTVTKRMSKNFRDSPKRRIITNANQVIGKVHGRKTGTQSESKDNS
jgi:hypothetical protein